MSLEVFSRKALSPRRVAIGTNLSVIHEKPKSHSPWPETGREAGMFQQRARAFHDLAHGTFTYGICLVTPRVAFPYGIPKSFNALVSSWAESVHAYSTTLPKKLDEGAVRVIGIFGEDREAIFIVGTSV